MTSYGGYGVCMTRSTAFLLPPHGTRLLVGLPNIRGGSEFGVEWHKAAKRRNRQTAYDDFVSAAEWLINTGRTAPARLAIFGGSNSGLLVGVALTQRLICFGLSCVWFPCWTCFVTISSTTHATGKMNMARRIARMTSPLSQSTHPIIKFGRE